MSDTNQELVHALKLLSKQYEQQFEEVHKQVNVLAEQIILLTNSETDNNDQILSQGGKTALELKKTIIAMNGESVCVDCKQAKFSIPVSRTTTPSQRFNFTCLLDHSNKEAGACYQFDSRF